MTTEVHDVSIGCRWLAALVEVIAVKVVQPRNFLDQPSKCVGTVPSSRGPPQEPEAITLNIPSPEVA